MLVYIIDGYNLIHRVTSLKNSERPQAELIRYIEKNSLTGSKTNRVIIVFDGNLDPALTQQFRSFKIIGSGTLSADEVIKKKVAQAKNKSQIVVVSDDRDIRDSIRQLGAKPCHLVDFIKKKPKEIKEEAKEISYTLQHEITEELRKIWLDDDVPG